MIFAGATTHYPAVLVHQDGRLVGSAILGYKTAETYRGMIEARLRATAQTTLASARHAPAAESTDRSGSAADSISGFGPAPGVGYWWKDFPVERRPGAYFRRLPGRSAIAFASQRSVYLLDFQDGRTMLAPGHVDLVPSPDGRLLVTPGPERSGLRFLDARAVFAAARRGAGSTVQPVFVDPDLPDQYPSVGIRSTTNAAEAGVAVYRVLTSWYDRAIFRDYSVQNARDAASLAVRPSGPPVPACPGYNLSLPIISPDGSELAARDEFSATTKLFRLNDDGGCDEILDLGIQTGKIAFSPDARRVAFAIPLGVVRDGRGVLWVGRRLEKELEGIFVLERDGLGITRIRGSEDAKRLAFPEFIGRDSIMFLMANADAGEESRFRLVCCLPEHD
ncbi:MAG: hypothetical protein ACRELD_09855 [Longimicrobiales bacterium]